MSIRIRIDCRKVEMGKTILASVMTDEVFDTEEEAKEFLEKIKAEKRYKDITPEDFVVAMIHNPNKEPQF